MSKNKKNKKKNIPWGLLLAIFIGIVCGFIMSDYIFGLGEDTPPHVTLLSLAGLFIGMYVALLFHTIVHEGGHLVFGRLTGYKFSSFRILSFTWVKGNDGKIRFKRLSLAGTAGQCLMAPPDMKDGKFPLFLYNLGGTLMNIIFSALFLIGYFLLGNIPFLSPLLLIFAFVGLMLALMNGIPMRMGTVDNDGYNAFVTRKNPDAVEALWIQLKIAEQTSLGVRLMDMPEWWFKIPSDEDMKNSMQATRAVFACNRLMDSESFDEADALMAHVLEIESGIVGLHRNLLICDRLFIEAIGQNRSEAILRMLTDEQKKFMKLMQRFPSVIRTEYTLALLFENNREKAELLLKKFEKSAASYPYAQEIESEYSLMKLACDKAWANTEVTA